MSPTTLWSKELNRMETVYDIKYDKNGFPMFLVYRGNQWLLRSAKHFSPAAPAVYREHFYGTD